MIEDELREHLQTTRQREKEALDALVKAQGEYEKAREAHHCASVAYDAHLARPTRLNSDAR